MYDQVTKALEDFEVVEFQGVPPNPEYAILMEAVKIVKDQNIDYLLAVGGGSVIDGVKFISSAAKFDAKTHGIYLPKASVPMKEFLLELYSLYLQPVQK